MREARWQETYREVVVIERDDLGAGVSSEPRRGVPQGRHAHGLLASGLRAIETLFPGTTDDVAAAGVPVGDVCGNMRVCPNGRRSRQRPPIPVDLARSGWVAE